MWFKRLSVLIAVLLLLPGCSNATGPGRSEFSAEIVLTGSKELDFTSRQPTGVVEKYYRQGDTIEVEFSNGTFTIDGIPHLPQTPEPLTVYSIEYLSATYGQIPMIQAEVASGTASVERWNQAYRAWERASQDFIIGVQRGYVDDLDSGMLRQAAAERALERLSAGELVEPHSARADTYSRPADNPMLHYRWKGMADECGLILLPKLSERPRTVADRMQPKEAEGLLNRLQLLGEPGNRRVRIELKFGNPRTDTGPDRG